MEYAIRCLRYIPDRDDGLGVVSDIGVWRPAQALFGIDFGSCPSGAGCKQYEFYLRQRQRHNLILASLENQCDPISAFAQIKSGARGPSGEFLYDGFFYDELIESNCQNVQRFLEFVQEVREDPELSECTIAVAVAGNFNSFLSNDLLMQAVQDDVDFWCPEAYYRQSDVPGGIVEYSNTGECGIPSLDTIASSLASSWPLVLEKTIPLLNVADSFLQTVGCSASDNYARKLSADGVSFGGYQSQYIRVIGEREGALQRLAGVGFFSDRIATHHTTLETDRAFKEQFLLRLGDDVMALGAPALFNWFGNIDNYAELSTPTPGVSRVTFFQDVESSDRLYASLRFPLSSVPTSGLYSLTFDYRSSYDLPLEGYLGFLNLQTGSWDMASYDRTPRISDSEWRTTTMHFDPVDNTSEETALHLALSWHDIAIGAGAFIELRNMALSPIRSDVTKSLFRTSQTGLINGSLDGTTGIIMGGANPAQLSVKTSPYLFPSGRALSVIVTDPDPICGIESPCYFDYCEKQGCGVWSTLRADVVDDLPAGRYEVEFWYRGSWTWCLPCATVGGNCVEQGCQERPWVGLFKPPWDLIQETRSNFALSNYDMVYAGGGDATGRRSDGQWRRLRFTFDLSQDVSGQGYGLHFADVWGDAAVAKSSSFEIDNLQLRREGDPAGGSRVIDSWVTSTSDFDQVDSQNLLAQFTFKDLVDMSFFPQSDAHLVLRPGPGQGDSSIDIAFNSPISSGLIGFSLWISTQQNREFEFSLTGFGGAALLGRRAHVAADSTVWQNATFALYVPDGSRAHALRVSFTNESGAGHAPVFLDELSVFMIAAGPTDLEPPPTVVTNKPRGLALFQNYPNPFNPTTTISFALPARTDVKLTIFDVHGRLVRRLVDDQMPPGLKRAEWDGRDEGGEQVASGVYFYRLLAGSSVLARKMVLLK